jgi:hypothetical protein
MRARGYGLFDVGFAAVYGWVGFVAAPSRSHAFQTVLAIVTGLLLVTGVVLLVEGERPRLGRWLGIVTSSLLLVFALACVVLLAISCAYLLGVYGAIGRALGALSLVGAALAVELFGLLPLFQLRFHLRAPR